MIVKGFFLLDELVQKGLVVVLESSLVLFIEFDFEEEYNFDFEKYDNEGDKCVKYKCNIFN